LENNPSKFNSVESDKNIIRNNVFSNHRRKKPGLFPELLSVAFSFFSVITTAGLNARYATANSKTIIASAEDAMLVQHFSFGRPDPPHACHIGPVNNPPLKVKQHKVYNQEFSVKR